MCFKKQCKNKNKNAFLIIYFNTHLINIKRTANDKIKSK